MKHVDCDPSLFYPVSGVTASVSRPKVVVQIILNEQGEVVASGMPSHEQALPERSSVCCAEPTGKWMPMGPVDLR